jgi:uncharacterized protein with PQ loop repeat
MARIMANAPTWAVVLGTMRTDELSGAAWSAVRPWVSSAASALVTLVQLGQFIPQHIELYQRKSVVGLSAWTIFFGSLYTYLTMIDYLVQSRGVWLRACTRSWLVCFTEIQPFVQVVGSWLLVSLLWFWYLRYEKLDEARELQRIRAGIVFSDSPADAHWKSPRTETVSKLTSPRPGPSTPLLSTDENSASDPEADATPDPQWWHAVPREHRRHAHYRHHRYYFDDSAHAALFFKIFLLVVVLVAVPAAGLIGGYDTGSGWLTVLFADVCGYLATLLCTVMWIPQIITTYTYGHRGSLSTLWVLFTFISDVVYSLYLAALGVPFSVWANNVPDGLCAVFLFFLIRVEERRERENTSKLHAPAGASVEPNESPGGCSGVCDRLRDSQRSSECPSL